MPSPVRLTAILFSLLVAVAMCSSVATAITVKIDYSKDTSNFFGANNPQGATGAAQAKASLEAVAAFYSEILEDTFTTFEIPDEFNGSLGGQVKWFWKQRVLNPSTGFNEAMLNATPPTANEFVVHVGARQLLGSEVALAGPGGFVGGFASRSGAFTTAEKTEIDAMETAFLNGTKRGQSTGFSSWGGSAAFDTDATWHFDRTTDPAAGTTDFFSVALHELAHTLGLGTSADWDKLVDGTEFKGANALAAYVPVGNVPLAAEADTGHWLQSIAASPIYEGAGTQLPIMVPVLNSAQTRRQLTDLDAAALADIGWQIDLPGGAASSLTLTNISSAGSSSSVVALSASAVPEPTGIVFVGMAAVCGLFFRSRSRRLA